MKYIRKTLMKCFKEVTLLACISAMFCASALANDIRVQRVRVNTSMGPSNDTRAVQFDIQWENSWWDARQNFDAAWVFIKYKIDAPGETWQHGDLYDTTTFSAGTAGYAEVIIPADLKGCFIQRKTSGSGQFKSYSVTLVWDFPGTMTEAEADQAIVTVFAVEMVYVPKGEFYLGDGDGAQQSTYAFNEWKDGARVDFTPVLISEITTQVSCGSNTVDDIDDTPISVNGQNGITGNANYPVGYEAFYIMKYETSQAQYRDFLNTLTQAQQETNVALTLVNENVAGDYALGGNPPYVTINARQIIRAGPDPSDGDPYVFGCDYGVEGSAGDGSFDMIDDGENIPVMITWEMFCAFTDWSGLRPMSELEFEKACRGSKAPVYGEYAWGTSTLTSAVTLGNSGLPNESVSESGMGLAAMDKNTSGLRGPLRCGFAAVDSSTSRSAAGASCWGVMELSGNIAELCASFGRVTGRTLEKTDNGDGALSVNGYADEPTWPGLSSGEVKTTFGGGTRGGSWEHPTTGGHVSYRFFASVLSTTVSYYGGRCVRSEP